MYRNALAREVRGLGYEIESRRNSRGRGYGFEIRGLSPELLEKYSQRGAQRDAAIEQFTAEHGRKPTDNEVAVLVRESRADKLIEISTERVREQQQARLSSEESHTLKHLHAESLERGQAISHDPSQAMISLQYAKEHLFERNSVVREHKLMTEALRQSGSSIFRSFAGSLYRSGAFGTLLDAEI